MLTVTPRVALTLTLTSTLVSIFICIFYFHQPFLPLHWLSVYLSDFPNPTGTLVSERRLKMGLYNDLQRKERSQICTDWFIMQITGGNKVENLADESRHGGYLDDRNSRLLAATDRQPSLAVNVNDAIKNTHTHTSNSLCLYEMTKSSI